MLYMMLVKGLHAVRNTLCQKLAASHEGQASLLVILVLF